MATRRLARTGLDDATVMHLSARNINTAKELLDCTSLDVSELLDCSEADAAKIILRVAEAVCPEPHTCAQLWARLGTDAVLATGLTALDETLRGGIPVGRLTEVVGPAGAGKTQMCLQLAVCAQVGTEGTVIYVDTESRFSALRMIEIGSGRFPDLFSGAESHAKLTRNVAVFSPGTSAELVALIGSLESLIIERAAKLVIVDSMAALMRADFSKDRLVERQAVLGEQAARLKRLAEAFRIPIVVTNQVQGGATAQPGQQHGETSIAAALGTKWAHDVNLRLMLELGDAGRRCVTIAKSAAAPALSFPYRVTSAGLQLDGPSFEAAFVTVDAGGGLEAPGMATFASEDLRTAFFSG